MALWAVLIVMWLLAGVGGVLLVVGSSLKAVMLSPAGVLFALCLGLFVWAVAHLWRIVSAWRRDPEGSPVTREELRKPLIVLALSAVAWLAGLCLAVLALADLFGV